MQRVRHGNKPPTQHHRPDRSGPASCCWKRDSGAATNCSSNRHPRAAHQMPAPLRTFPPGLSADSGVEMSRKTGYRSWTTAETKILKEKARDMGMSEVAQLLGRSYCSVRQMSNRLGVRFKNWSKEEDELLATHYPTKGPGGCAKLLNGRTRTAVRSRAARLGLTTRARYCNFKEANPAKKLGLAEIEAVKYYRYSIWPGKKIQEIADSLKVSHSTVRRYIRESTPDYIPPQFRGPL